MILLWGYRQVNCHQEAPLDELFHLVLSVLELALTIFDLQFRSHYVAIDPDLLEGQRKVAASRGLSAESLINLWLQEKLLAPT